MIIQWQFFQFVYTELITPILVQLQAMVGNVCAAMQPVATAMVLIWMGFVGFDMANGTKTAQAAMKDVFIAGMVIGALQVGQYTQYVSDFFLQAVPNTVSIALGGNGNPASGLDQVLDAAVTAGAKCYEALPSWSLKSLPLGIGVLVFLIVALVAVGYTFAIFMIAAIVNVAAIVVGPVFLALAAIPFTRRFASGWLGVLVGGACTQLMALAVILLLAGAETTLIQRTVTTVAGSDSNSIALLWGLAQCGLLLALCAAVVKKIPSIGAAIGGGVHHGSSVASAPTFGLATAGATLALGGARGAAAVAGKAGSAAIGQARASLAYQPPQPTGPSLSRKP